MVLPLLWKILYWSWIVTEVLVLLVTRTRRGGGNISDRGSLIVLWLVIFSSISLGSWAQEAAGFAAFSDSAPWIRPVALGLLILGLSIRWSAIYTLGRSFSANVAIHAMQTLNRSGLFRYMRHPSYTGMVLIFLALGLRSRNWLALAFFVVPPVAALLYRIHVEEAALTGAFGEQYTDYSRTTKRLVPGIY
jgi:protein-S-isoprenylcysteine O-methyltransferase Ste14